MASINETINRLGSSIAEQCHSVEVQAKESLFIFLIGCYCSEHKKYLLKAEEEILKKGIPCASLKTFKVPGLDDPLTHNYALKFKVSCKSMLQSYRFPIPFIYGSHKLSTCGDGVAAELVTLFENPDYEKLKGNIRLFEERGMRLPDQHKYIVARYPVLNGDDFIVKTIQVCDIEFNKMLDILTKNQGVTHAQ